eukprot:CAMPEP_0176489120 /NCGR_PEP_ID=MMETSP0200_2-20121128/7106_1 /TAXON_ID=947934 /ORGANISM="Chaetoceros sp., Strain GSL56" /LENGTH=951 /DNA_ID=CAMNT_0017886215 /DNA_START=128 /DNA_END=2983 /DNA_ORIENTATION=-
MVSMVGLPYQNQQDNVARSNTKNIKNDNDKTIINTSDTGDNHNLLFSPSSVAIHSLGASNDSNTGATGDDDDGGDKSRYVPRPRPTKAVAAPTINDMLLDPNQSMDDQSLPRQLFDHSVSNADDGPCSNHCTMVEFTTATTMATTGTSDNESQLIASSTTTNCNTTTCENVMVNPSSTLYDKESFDVDHPTYKEDSNNDNHHIVSEVACDDKTEDSAKVDNDDCYTGDKGENEDDMDWSNSMTDVELDKAVQKILLKTDSMSSSSSQSFLYVHDDSESVRNDEGGPRIKRNESSLQNDAYTLMYEIANSTSSGSNQEKMQSTSIVDNVALQWLHDENNSVDRSISSVSLASSKTKSQKRLESYARKIPSLSQLKEQMDAASKRRDSVLQITKEKADKKASFLKVSEKILMAEARVKSLSEKLYNKMDIANDRKEAYIKNFYKGKAVATTYKLQKVQTKQERKNEKIFEMQQRLESKLMMAYNRREKIVAEKSARASSDISSSTERAKIASQEKELLIQQIRLKSEAKIGSASSRRKRLHELEKEKQEVLMLRREIAKSFKADNKLKSAQKKLHDKMASAHERKESFLAARKAKAAEHLLSSSDRNAEVLEMTEIMEEKNKTKLEHKMVSAEKRRLKLAQKYQITREKKKERYQQTLKVGIQQHHEIDAILSFDEVSLPTLVETEEFVGTPLSTVSKHSLSPNNYEDNAYSTHLYNDRDEYCIETKMDKSSESDYNGDNSSYSYEEQRLQAKQQLVDEIHLANMAKLKEMEYLAKQVKKPSFTRMHRNVSISAESFGTLDSNEVLSLDDNEMDISISGLSTILKNEEKSIENKKAQAALVLAELDITLSEIQLMQAIILAEEASLSGKTEFKTSDQSVEDLNRVQVNETLFEHEKNNKLTDHKGRLKNTARLFLSNTLHQAKIAKDKAGKTLFNMKNKIEVSELERKKRNYG